VSEHLEELRFSPKELAELNAVMSCAFMLKEPCSAVGMPLMATEPDGSPFTSGSTRASVDCMSCCTAASVFCRASVSSASN